jgi:hypothetical protein
MRHGAAEPHGTGKMGPFKGAEEQTLRTPNAAQAAGEGLSSMMPTSRHRLSDLPITFVWFD